MFQRTAGSALPTGPPTLHPTQSASLNFSPTNYGNPRYDIGVPGGPG